MKPLVSIIIPIFNEEKHLKECIESVLSQTYTNWELILVNDDSTDKTAEIIDLFLNNFPQRIVKLNLKRQGDGAGVNKGLEISTGKYVARMDGDDIMMPLRIEKQVKFLEENPTIGAIGTGAYLIDGNGKVTGKRINPIENSAIQLIIDKCGYPIIHPTLMIRYEILAKIPYREILMAAEDLALWLDLAPKTQFANLNELLIKKRLHKGSMTGNLTRARIVAYNTRKIVLQHFWAKKDYLEIIKILIIQLKSMLVPNFIYVWRMKKSYKTIEK